LSRKGAILGINPATESRNNKTNSETGKKGERHPVSLKGITRSLTTWKRKGGLCAEVFLLFLRRMGDSLRRDSPSLPKERYLSAQRLLLSS